MVGGSEATCAEGQGRSGLGVTADGETSLGEHLPQFQAQGLLRGHSTSAVRGGVWVFCASEFQALQPLLHPFQLDLSWSVLPCTGPVKNEGWAGRELSCECLLSVHEALGSIPSTDK